MKIQAIQQEDDSQKKKAKKDYNDNNLPEIISAQRTLPFTSVSASTFQFPGIR